MKKMLLIIALLSASMIANADHFYSKLILKMFDHSLISVSVDNEPFTQTDDRIVIHNLQPGMHRITVYKYRQQWNTFVLVSDGTLHIPANSEVRATVTNKFKLKVTQITPIEVPVVYQPYPLPAPVAYGPQCMSMEEFQSLKSTIDNQWFEETRLAIAKQAIASHRVNAHQVLELMQMMWFESSKLELAKYAYNFTVDRQNYFIVNNGFSFSSSVHELQLYISQMG